nr:hypothetical protein [Nanoarchaeum sp.]
MNSLQTFRATALLCGTIIGAGVLGIPYIISQVGFIPGIFIIILIGLAMMMLNLFLGEIILRTPGNHQLPGYAERYLGKTGKKLMMFSMIFGIYGALIAYIIGSGQALATVFGLSSLTFSIAFFIVASGIVYIGLKAIAKSELFFIVAVFLIFGGLFIYSLFSGKFNLANLAVVNLKNIFLPYGVVLFAFIGTAAIPEMKEYLTHDKKKLKKAIILGSLIPLITYLLFTFVVLGITGLNTTEIATIGLGEVFGEYILVIGNLFAVVAMFTSFLTLALAMKEVYLYDYKFKNFLAWALTVIIPFIIFLTGFTSFIKIIGITGAVAGGVDGILIVLMFWKARKMQYRIPEYKLGKKHTLGFLLMLMFILGLIYQFYSLI